MHAVGRYAGASMTLHGNCIVSFDIGKAKGEVEKLQQDTDLVIDVKKYREHRSLSANAYFWVLCDSIAKVLKTTKECIYLMQLSRYGVFVDVDVIPEAVHMLQEKFRYTEVFEDEGTDIVTVRCYFGSSTYNTEEMSRLIEGTVNDAKDIGVDTWTPEEIARALAVWDGGKDGRDL